MNGASRWVGLLAWLCVIAGFGGGTLWALSPLGARLSEEVLRAPNLFWELFPSAPLLMLVGLVGLYLYSRGDGGGLLRKAGFAVASLGAVLVIAGDIGLYQLGLDDIFIMSAPAYRTLRVGLFVFAAGTLFFAIVLARGRSLALVGTLPLVLGAFAGTVAVVRDLGQPGSGMWIAFGATFAWCSLVVMVAGMVAFFKGRKAGRSVEGEAPG